MVGQELAALLRLEVKQGLAQCHNLADLVSSLAVEKFLQVQELQVVVLLNAQQAPKGKESLRVSPHLQPVLVLGGLSSSYTHTHTRVSACAELPLLRSPPAVVTGSLFLPAPPWQLSPKSTATSS